MGGIIGYVLVKINPVLLLFKQIKLIGKRELLNNLIQCYMFRKIYNFKKRMKQELKSIKTIFKNDKLKIIKMSYIITESVKIIYNPWYILDLIYKHTLISN